MLKMPLMASIAKRLVFAQPAAAKRYDLSSAQVVGVAKFIYYFKIAFYFKGTIVVEFAAVGNDFNFYTAAAWRPRSRKLMKQH